MISILFIISNIYLSLLNSYKANILIFSLSLLEHHGCNMLCALVPYEIISSSILYYWTLSHWIHGTGIYTFIYHRFGSPNVGKIYFVPWILWVLNPRKLVVCVDISTFPNGEKFNQFQVPAGFLFIWNIKKAHTQTLGQGNQTAPAQKVWLES